MTSKYLRQKKFEIIAEMYKLKLVDFKLLSELTDIVEGVFQLEQKLMSSGWQGFADDCDQTAQMMVGVSDAAAEQSLWEEL